MYIFPSYGNNNNVRELHKLNFERKIKVKNKVISREEYNNICKEYHSDIKCEELEDEQIYDLAKCVIDSGDVECEKIVSYLKSHGVKDCIGRFADDIAAGRAYNCLE